MPKYLVRVPYVVWLNIEVDANDSEEAQDKACGDFGLSGYCGNGGSNKLVGVHGEHLSVEACDEPLDMEGIGIEVEEIG
jgi:hypothetical protein